ncbi:AsmA family protein [Flavobacterium silvaticum]|uniref:AsmA family protein n=1 Tax=Flavobacterium silvaticum TaxID=1852020 RepID=A0A972FMV6_9FLAO|nr:AsmA-like C-terminal region-containing protein [Flavobacterium silvaticum]NMH28150.1 AsmA family protein [Flavobacterium silvaticum]
MNARLKTIIVKTLKWTGIGIGSLLLLMFLLPILFPGQIAEQVKGFANKKLTGELNFSKARLSFFDHFPSLTVTLDDFSLKGSAPFQKDTLVAAEDIGFGINLKRLLFDGEIVIDEIYVGNSDINVKVNEKGQANYNVYISDDNAPKDTVSNTSLRLDKIKISHCNLRYHDASAKIVVSADDFNYVGKGSLDQAIFDLASDAKIGSLDFELDGEHYLLKKNLQAELLTRINTNALTFSLQRNDLKINKLPINFKGVLNILKNGYDIDLSVKSMGSDFEDLFTALPPEYITWLDSTKVKGEIDIALTMKGRYDATTNRQPTIKFHTAVRDGYIEYKKAPVATSDINLNLDAILPSLNPEELSIKLDSLTFKLGKEKFRSYIAIKGMENMSVKASLKGKLDMETLDKSIGLKNIDMKGLLMADVNVNGIYNAKEHLFPKTKGRVLIKYGFIKTDYYPNPITKINLDINAENTNGKYSDTWIKISPATLTFEGEPFDLNATFSNLDDVAYDVSAKGLVNVGKVYRVFAQKGIDVDGMIRADLRLKGRQSYATNGEFSKLDNRGTLEVRKIKASMESFPKSFLIENGLFTFKQQDMNFDSFNATYGQSDFNLNGKLVNAINYFFEKHATLHGNFVLNSKYINVNEFMALKPGNNPKEKAETKAAESVAPSSSGVVVLPTNLDVSLTANAQKITYDKFNLENLRGTVGISKGQLTFRGTQIDIIGATLNLDGMYDDESALKAGFDLRFQAKNFDIQRAFKEIEMFKELATSAGNAQGIISVDYKLKGVLDGNMNPVYNSLEGNGVVSLKKIKVKGLKLFSGLSQKTGSDGINDPDLSKVDIKTHIKDNVIFVDETKMKIALFRLKFEGKTSFDGQLALKIRLGLPPLGLIGIPLAVTGTQSDPKIKVFSKTTDEVPQSEYKGKDVITQPQGAVTPVTTEESKNPEVKDKDKP